MAMMQPNPKAARGRCPAWEWAARLSLSRRLRLARVISRHDERHLDALR
jgi:hypothetical protein